MIADTTRRSIEGVTKATGFDLFGKNRLKSAVPTPPAVFDMPPPDRLHQESNFAELGHEAKIPPEAHMSPDIRIPKRAMATQSAQVHYVT